MGRGPRGRGRRRRGRQGRLGRTAHGRRGGAAAATGASTGCVTRSSSPKRPARRCSTAWPSGAWPGRWATRRPPSATSWACRRRSGSRPAGPWTALGVAPQRVLVDGRWDFIGGGITRTIVKGDATCLSIATASILAKVSRDRIMRADRPGLRAVRVRPQQGLPVARAPGRAPRARPHRHPPPLVGVHGRAAGLRAAVARPRRDARPDRPLRLTLPPTPVSAPPATVLGTDMRARRT